MPKIKKIRNIPPKIKVKESEKLEEKAAEDELEEFMETISSTPRQSKFAEKEQPIESIEQVVPQSRQSKTSNEALSREDFSYNPSASQAQLYDTPTSNIKSREKSVYKGTTQISSQRIEINPVFDENSRTQTKTRQTFENPELARINESARQRDYYKETIKGEDVHVKRRRIG